MNPTVSTAQLRQQLAETLNRARYARDRIVVERNGTPVAAIVSLSDLEALEAIEDAADAHAADEAKAEGGARPLADVLRDLRSDP
jgi:prevent-host-death family protein